VINWIHVIYVAAVALLAGLFICNQYQIFS